MSARPALPRFTLGLSSPPPPRAAAFMARWAVLAAAGLGVLIAASTVRAESLASSAASTASSAGSASLGSLSDSLQGSSQSSQGKDKVAQGLYEVIEIARLPVPPGQAERIELLLRPTDGPQAPAAGGAEFRLRLPAAALGDQPLRVGARVLARHRDYGLAFARAETARQPFYLVLDDGWRHELDARPVRL